MAQHLEDGKAAEEHAAFYLKKQGYVILATNFHSRFGELDIICRTKKELVFVEVRLRKNQRFGSAAETVSIHKQRKLTKTAMVFLNQHPKLHSLFMRFDVIGMDASNNIQWIKGAFQATT